MHKDQFILVKYLVNLGSPSLLLHNLTTKKFLAELPIPDWPLAQISIGTFGPHYRIAFWSPFKYRLHLIKIDTNAEKFVSEGKFEIIKGARDVIIAENASELWTISNTRPFIDIVNLNKKKYISRFFLPSSGKESITFRNYNSVYLPDRKIALIAGICFEGSSLMIINLLPKQRKAIVLQKIELDRSLARESSISCEYQDSKLIFLLGTGNFITICDIEGNGEKLSISLIHKINVSKKISGFLGDVKQVTVVQKNDWLLLRYKRSIGLIRIGKSRNDYPYFVPLDLTKTSELADWYLTKDDELWLASQNAIHCVYKIEDFRSTTEERKKIDDFQLPLSAVGKEIIMPKILDRKA